MSVKSSIRSFFIEGPAGRIEALLNIGAPSAAHCAVVAHPHPLYGGTLHNKVVFHAMKALNSFGFPVLRFNFRGAGTSAGEHDQGRGEVDDVRITLDWLDREFGLPIIFAGFSFGAAVGLRAACPDPRVAALVALGLPLNAEGRGYEYDYLRNCAKPKLFLSGNRDQYAPASQLSTIVSHTGDPKRLLLIKDADHFFAGHLDEMRDSLIDWLRETVC